MKIGLSNVDKHGTELNRIASKEVQVIDILLDSSLTLTALLLLGLDLSSSSRY